MSKVLLIVTNVDWFLISHRLVIAKAASEAGWKVYVACEDTGRASEISINSIEFVDFPFSRSGTNPFDEIRTIIRFKKLYKKIKPDVVHQITLKPVVYGGFAAKRLGVKGVVNAISGLGYTFTAGRVGIVQKAILKIMKYGFNRENVSVIFQNNEDKILLSELNMIDRRNDVHLIKGSGVDLNHYAQIPLPSFDIIKILLPCRMLWDKGVRELREATEMLKDKYKGSICFILAGLADDQNKAGVPAAYLKDWEDENYVIWIGNQSDMIQIYKNCHIVVLPSYREGLPKTLIEACAVGRAIVTTDGIGCRDCVEEGINGFKVKVGSSKELAKALETLVLNHELIRTMGQAGREKAEREFDVNEVIRKHLQIYNTLLN